LMEFDRILQETGVPPEVHIETVHLEEAFIDIAGRFADEPGTVALMSGGHLDSARYHILAARPWLSLRAYGRRIHLKTSGRSAWFDMDPLDMLRCLIQACSLPKAQASVPVAAGLFGYLAYDLKDFIEDLPRTSLDDLSLPHLCLYAPSILLVHDKQSTETQLCIVVRHPSGANDRLSVRKAFFDTVKNARSADTGAFSGGATGFFSPFSRQTYMTAVEKIKEYIVAGHIYQVNLSQRFESDFWGSPFSLFKTLFEAAPGPFYAFVNAEDHHIVSTSPERFLMRRGRTIETRPIKGTRPRGKTKAEDAALADALKKSKKDDAELSMIVDLMRNDLGRVCAAGSVKVAEHRRLETYQNVFHLVSVVKGELAERKDTVDLIRAAFPGGSITGCPRIRAMEIIDEMEPCRRHIYTGSIGYIGFHDTMDLSIAIRTATIAHGRIFFSVGGGVVFDSDPADEYDETLHKGRSIMRVFEGRRHKGVQSRFVWMNGGIAPSETAMRPVLDKGLQYGYGFFETIRVNQGAPLYLTEHMTRFHKAWDALFQTPRPDVTWEEIIRQVIDANRLKDAVAAVKITATWGDRDTPPIRHGLIVSAAPYTHRLTSLKKSGLSIATYPHPRQTPLADHKTLNYLYYFLAGKWAGQNGADEALILNPDGSVSETNTANLLMIRGMKVIRPASPHVLFGVMEQAVLTYLEKTGFQIETRRITMDALFSCDALMLTNSLMGAVPVLSIDGKQLPSDKQFCKKISGAVLETDLNKRIFHA